MGPSQVNRRTLAGLATLAMLCASCTATRPDSVSQQGDDRPRVFRSVLDGRPRMLSARLGDGLWAAYDARTAALYKVWRDGVSLDGAVYDYRHGPQPRAVGPAYVLRTGRTPWRIVAGGARVRPTIQYRGHRIMGDSIVILSELRYGDVRIGMEEEIARASGAPSAVSWTFRPSGVPEGVELEYLVDLDSLAEPPGSDGALTGVRRGPGSRYRAALAVARNRATVLRASFAEPRIAAEVVPEVDQGWARLESAGCPSCHATEARTVGPALVEIAEQYDADPETVAGLAEKVRAGGRGVWGDTAMPAHDFLTQEEAEDLVTFVLALDGDDAAARRFAGERATDRDASLWKLAIVHGPALTGQWFKGLFEDVFLPSSDSGPGDGMPLEDAHPSFDVESVRPFGFEPKVGGMDFAPNGDLVLATWDPQGAVYRLSGVTESSPEVQTRPIASGLGEPLGVRVVGEDIFVLQKHELTRLVDRDGDGVTDEYETISNDWQSTGNFHEFAFGLVADDEGFLATLSSGVAPGGASATSQPIDRGSVIRITRDGSATPIARGFRTPNGIGVVRGDKLFVTDNQGAWLPASKIVHVTPGSFYGFRDVDPEGDAARTETPPVAWLPQDEIGNSPSEPVSLDVGPYRDQVLFGDVTHGGIKRLYVEEVEGALQGAVFRFSQGLEAGVNRLVWGPDGRLYVGGIGNPGNWAHAGRAWFGLERLTFNGETTFEMLAVRALPEGFEIELTEPLAEAVDNEPSHYRVQQWRYEPTPAYGGPKVGLETLEVTTAAVSEDRRTIRLEIEGLREGSVVHVRLDPETIRSRAGASLWTTEAWYTLNRIPSRAPAPRGLRS